MANPEGRKLKLFHYHSHNLNEKPLNRRGWKMRHGHAWLHWRTGNMHWEWNWFRRSGTLGFSIDLAQHDESFGFSIQLAWLFAFYFGITTPRSRRWLERITSREKEPHRMDMCKRCNMKEATHGFSPCGLLDHAFEASTYWSTNGRDIGVSIHDWTVWIDLWSDPMHWSSSDPRWWHTSIHLLDLLLGRREHSDGIVFDKQQVLIPMPEGGYPATITMREEVWKRPRWFAKKLRRAHIEMEMPIPFPGKGESAWDCGEDATHSMCCVADTILDGTIAMTRSVMLRRIRYGGHGWMPRFKEGARA